MLPGMKEERGKMKKVYIPAILVGLVSIVYLSSNKNNVTIVPATDEVSEEIALKDKKGFSPARVQKPSPKQIDLKIDSIAKLARNS